MIEDPLGWRRLRLLDLILLLKRVDPVFALNVGLARLDAALTGVDGIGDVVPVLLTEVTAVELDITIAPGVDQCLGGTFAPTILSTATVTGASRVRAVHEGNRVWTGRGKGTAENKTIRGGLDKNGGVGIWVGSQVSDSDPCRANGAAIGLGRAL